MRFYADFARPFGIDPDEIQALAEIESEHDQRARSPVGAIGILQVMPETGRWFCGLSPAQLANAWQNLRCGTAYYAHLRARFRGNPVLAVAAYNAGPKAVEDWRGVPPYAETQRHVQKWAKAF